MDSPPEWIQRITREEARRVSSVALAFAFRELKTAELRADRLELEGGIVERRGGAVLSLNMQLRRVSEDVRFFASPRFDLLAGPLDLDLRALNEIRETYRRRARPVVKRLAALSLGADPGRFKADGVALMLRKRTRDDALEAVG